MAHYPLLPLRDIVVFPGMVVPLFVGREKSVAALEAAMAGNKEIFLLAQLDPGCDDPDRDDLYDTGVIASVLQLLKLPDGTVRVLVEGHRRAELQALNTETTSDGEMVVADDRHVLGKRNLGPGRPAEADGLHGIVEGKDLVAVRRRLVRDLECHDSPCLARTLGNRRKAKQGKRAVGLRP